MCMFVVLYGPRGHANWCHPRANRTRAERADKSSKIIVVSLDLKIEQHELKVHSNAILAWGPFKMQGQVAGRMSTCGS